MEEYALTGSNKMDLPTRCQSADRIFDNYRRHPCRYFTITLYRYFVKGIYKNTSVSRRTYRKRQPWKKEREAAGNGLVILTLQGLRSP